VTSSEDSAGVRLDKWLWAARFFKTRSRAAEAVSGGKVHLNGARVKAAKQVRVGDTLSIRQGPYELTVVVRGLGAQRRPAREAASLYEETEASKAERARLRAEVRAATVHPAHAYGRPSKKGRRDIAKFTRGSRGEDPCIRQTQVDGGPAAVRWVPSAR